MNEQLQQLQSSANEFWERTVGYFSQPWFAYELLIIVVLFIAAKLLSSRLSPRLETAARSIKAHPGLLRLIVTLLRRTDWVLFVLALAVTLGVMRSVTWPSRSHFISVVLTLAFAWLTISVLSRVIRSRMVARVVAGSVWFYVAVSVLGVTEEVATFLGDLGFSMGETRISALLVIKGLVLLSISLWLAISLGNFLDNRIQRSDELTPSLRVLIGKVIKITFMVVAVVTAMSGLGIDLTAFTVFSGAVGVGVGFGLQKVVSNFISGIIILLDRSIKPGDTISLGDTFGWIRELRARFVSVVTRDGREYLIPNEDFITQQVINWSFSNELVRLDVEFGVSYESDPHVVSRLAIDAATGVPRVVQDQKPVCWMTGFGDSSLDFVLRFWIQDPQNGLTNIRGKVLLALWDSFKENGIAIPYPHRDLIIRQPLRIQSEPGLQGRNSHDDARS